MIKMKSSLIGSLLIVWIYFIEITYQLNNGLGRTPQMGILFSYAIDNPAHFYFKVGKGGIIWHVVSLKKLFKKQQILFSAQVLLLSVINMVCSLINPVCFSLICIDSNGGLLATEPGRPGNYSS